MTLSPRLRRFVLPAAGAALGALVFGIILGLRTAGLLQGMELRTYDLTLRLITANDRVSNRITIVRIDERYVQEYSYPITDAAMAELLAKLLAHEPRAIGVDIFRDIEVPPGREKLNEVLTSDPRIVVVWRFGRGANAVQPPPVLKGTDQTGFAELPIDADGVGRRDLMFLDDGENFYQSMPLLLAMRYLATEGIYPQADEANPEHMRLGKTTFRPFEANDGAYVEADAAGYSFLMDFRGPHRFPTLTIHEVMADDFDASLIRDRVVLIGMDATSVKDHFITPIDTEHLGVKVHAHRVDQLLRAALDGDAPMRSWPDRHEAFWILGWSVLGGLIGLAAGSPLRFAFLSVIGLAVLIGVCFAAFARGLWLPLVPPALCYFVALASTTALLTLLERRERVMLHDIFGRLVSDEVADTIWSQREQIMVRGRLRSLRTEGTVMFTDLEGFTSFAESRDPEEVMLWLNHFWEKMAAKVTEHGGVVTRFMGDAIMAVFGPPIPRVPADESARNAVCAALAMRRQMRVFEAEREKTGMPRLRMRIGLFSGPLVSGTIGSADRLEYTVFGNTVNTAARLETYDKQLMDEDIAADGCRILIGDLTRQHLDERFRTRSVGELSLRGRTTGVLVHGVIDGPESAGPPPAKEVRDEDE